MTDTPQTVSGTTLAAFLHGLLPEDDGLAKQIARAEEQAAAAERRATVERIRERVTEFGFAAQPQVLAILDEEAGRG